MAALDSAIHAAVAEGLYADVPTAAAAMGSRKNAYLPDPARYQEYNALYRDYLRLHNHFGSHGSDGAARWCTG